MKMTEILQILCAKGGRIPMLCIMLHGNNVILSLFKQKCLQITTNVLSLETFQFSLVQHKKDSRKIHTKMC